MPGAELAVQASELSRGLQQLPDQQRAAVLLVHQGLSRREIAAVLGCTTGTVRVHLHLGRTRLRELIGEPQRSRQKARNAGVEGRTA